MFDESSMFAYLLDIFVSSNLGTTHDACEKGEASNRFISYKVWEWYASTNGINIS